MTASEAHFWRSFYYYLARLWKLTVTYSWYTKYIGFSDFIYQVYHLIYSYIFSNVTFWNTWFRKYYKCLKILQVLQSIQMLNSSYFAQKFGLRIKCFSGTPLYVTWKEFVDTQVSHSRSLKAESKFNGQRNVGAPSCQEEVRVCLARCSVRRSLQKQ